MKALKFTVAIFLIPSCIAVTRMLLLIFKSLQPAELSHIPLTTWGFILGFCSWIIIYLCLPRFTRTYILGHELTHLLWAWLLGIEAGHLRVSKLGGSVVVAKHHFLVTLAPYFFPLYTILVIIARFLVNVFYDMSPYDTYWLAGIGLTWSFHLTFTLSMLRREQPDLEQEGYLFSYVIIYILNVIGIALWIVLGSSIPVTAVLQNLKETHMQIFQWEAELFQQVFQWLTSLLQSRFSP